MPFSGSVRIPTAILLVYTIFSEDKAALGKALAIFRLNSHTFPLVCTIFAHKNEAIKHFRKIMQCLVAVVIGVYVVMYALFNLPPSRAYLTDVAARTLSEKLHTHVSIEDLEVGLFNRVMLHNVRIDDQQGRPMLKGRLLSAKINLGAILTEKRVALHTISLLDLDVRLRQDAKDAPANFQFILDAFKSKSPDKKSPLDLRINSLIVRRTHVSWTRSFIPEKGSTIDSNHLDIKDLDASISLKVLTDDSLNLRVRHLSLTERSGLKINRLALRLAANRREGYIASFTLDLPHSHLAQEKLKIKYDTRRFLHSLNVKGTLRQSRISLSDLAFLVKQKDGSEDLRFTLSSRFDLRSSRWMFKDVRLESADGEFSFHADVALRREARKRIDATLHELQITPGFAQSVTSRFTSRELPEFLERLGRVSVSGQLGYEQKTLDFTGKITTNAGEISGSGLYADNHFEAHLSTDGFDVGQVMADTARFGRLSAEISAKGRGREQAVFRTDIRHFRFGSHDYSNVGAEGQWDGRKLSATLNADAPDLRLTASGSVSLPRPLDGIDIIADVSALSPHALGWTQRYASTTFSGRLTANVHGASWTKVEGNVRLGNFRMASADTTCVLDTLALDVGRDAQGHYVRLRSDFATADYRGRRPLFESLPHVASYLRPYLPTPLSSPADVFQPASAGSFRVHVDNTRLAEHLADMPVTLTAPLTAEGYWTDTRSFSLSATTGGIRIGETAVDDIKIFGRGDGRKAHAVVQASKPMKNTDIRASVELTASEDSLRTDLTWADSDRQAYRGDVHLSADFTRFTSEKKEVGIDMLPGRVYINDTLWDVGRGRLDWSGRRLHIDNFSLSHGAQQLSLAGSLERGSGDTLAANLRDIEIGYIMDLINFHAVDFAGRATGHVVLTNSIDDPHISARIDIADFLFNQASMGSLAVEAAWNRDENQVDLAAIMAEPGLSQTYINGFISPRLKGLDLRFRTQGTNLQFINRYLEGIFSDVTGRASGHLSLHGPFKALDLEGQQAVHMECHVVPTGADYTIESDSVVITPGRFAIHDIRLADAMGGQGSGYGELRHKNLRELTYDFNLRTRNLLAYDRPKELDMPFFATARVTGGLRMEGRPGAFNADIDIRPERGTQLTYILDRPETTNSSQFITFRDRSLVASAASGTKFPPTTQPMPAATDIRLNFLIDMNPEVNVRVLMDEDAGDAIDLAGQGAIRASFYNKGDFQLFGTYSVDRGTYKLSLQDVIRKEFTIQPGSSITFIGDPGNSDLDLQAVYTVNSASLSDLNIGSNFTSSTVRVNCLLNVGGKVSSPQLSFDLDLPTVNADEKQMVRNIISTEEDMNMQILYLLGVGRFYTYDYGSTATASTQSQSSVAMKSFLSNTLTGQLNNIISNAIGPSNWSFGTNLSTGEVGWSDMEVEGLLSGRLLNNRLLINGNFGYRDRAAYSTGFVGDFDIQWLLTPSGSVSLKAYSESNDRYFTKSSLSTQGIGLILKRDFTRFGDMFRWGRRSSRNDTQTSPSQKK